MGSIKYVSWLGFTPDELAGMKEYLEAQALKGWFPDPFYASLGLVLKRGEPETVTYYITYADFNEEDYRDGPWEYLGQFGKEHIFASRTSRAAPPGSSEEVQFSSAKYILLSRMLPIVGIFLLLTAGFIIMDLRNPGELLFNSRRQRDFVGILFLAFAGALFLVREGLWIWGNNLRLKNGKPIHWNGLTHARVQSLLIVACSMMLIFGIGRYGAGPAVFTAVYLLSIWLIPILSTVILNISYYLRTKKGTNMPDGPTLRWITAGIILILVFSFTLMAIRVQEHIKNREEAAGAWNKSEGTSIKEVGSGQEESEALGQAAEAESGSAEQSERTGGAEHSLYGAADGQNDMADGSGAVADYPEDTAGRPEDDTPDAVVRELGLPVEHFYGTSPSGQWSAYGKLKGETYTYLLYNKQSGEMQTYSVPMERSAGDARLLMNAQESMAAVSFHDGKKLGYRLIATRYKKLLNGYCVFEDERFRNELSLANQDFDALLSEQPRQWISDRILEVGIHYRNGTGKSCYGTYQLKVESFEESGFEVCSADLDEEAAENQRVLEDMGQVTPEELTETEMKGWNSWDGIRYPLIARLPEDDIYLYGFSGNYYMKGVVLRYKDKIQTFPWSYAARDTLPKMAFKDYDQDGEKELAVSLYNGSGTGVSIEELHILELGKDGGWTDHEFTEGRYERLFEQAASFTDHGGDEFELQLEGKAYRVKKQDDWSRIKNMSFINIVAFDLGKEVVMEVSPKIYPYSGSPVNKGRITAKVGYRDGEFTLTGFSWKEEE